MRGRVLTRDATPKFSIAGILLPVVCTWLVNYCSFGLRKCSICSFPHTSKIQLTLLDGVDIRERRLDELRGEPHLGGFAINAG